MAFYIFDIDSSFHYNLIYSFAYGFKGLFILIIRFWERGGG